MTTGSDFARRGFDLLLQRPDFVEFFDALAAEHIFDPELNPAPEAADTPGYFRIPYWEPLKYLEAVAKLAGKSGDMPLAEKVMHVVRAVSLWRDANGTPRDNHHTFHAFAKILGFVPTKSVTVADIDLVPIWLGGIFNRSSAAFAFAEGGVKRFLDSDDADDWRKACRLIEHCTNIVWVDDKLGQGRKKAGTQIDDFWVKELLKGTPRTLGTKLGREAALLFLKRVCEVYGDDFNQKYSYVSRPAVEDHAQNRSFRGPENWSVEGLRDVLLGWLEAQPTGASVFVNEMSQDRLQMVRRVCLYLLDVRFELLRGTYANSVSASLFVIGHLHELYNLLRNHFFEFSDSEKSATITAIREIPASTSAEDPARSLKHVQRQWLSAIAERGSREADDWYSGLMADPTLGGQSPHPDFASYMETRWGHVNQRPIGTPDRHPKGTPLFCVLSD